MAAQSQAGRIGIWGASGSGKSHYTKKRFKSAKRVIVFDTMREYGAEGFETVGPELDAVRRAIVSNPRGFRIAYAPPPGPRNRSLNALSFAIRKMQEAYAEGRGGAPVTFIVDELRLAFPVNGGAEKCPEFSELCSTGRHYGITLVGTSQRIAEVSTNFRGNCSETVIFEQKGPRDVKAAALELGLMRGGDELVAELAKQKFHHLHAANGSVRLINQKGREIRKIR